MIDKQRLRQAGLQSYQVFARLLPLMSVGLFVLLPGQSQKTIADDEVKTDAAVLDEIFGDTVIAANVRAVRRQAAAMPAVERHH